MDIHCPNCHTDFEGEVWVDGNCPCCLECYYWDCSYNPDVCDEEFIDVYWY